MSIKLPNLIIGGAPKCGTSSLHVWLADHPEAVGSVPKETYYFVDPDTHMYNGQKHINRGLDGYGEFFPTIPESSHQKVVFESTPSYLYSRTALQYLPNLPSHPRFIFLLREPAAQIRSLYLYFRENWRWVPRDMSFRDFISAVRGRSYDFGGNELARQALAFANYCPYLERWYDRLGPKRMRVFLFEDMVMNPRGFMEQLSIWLGIDPKFYKNYAFPRENQTYAVRSHRLQAVNILLRSRLPRGVIYLAVRRIYRYLNTRHPDGPDWEEQRILERLRAEYDSANFELAIRFGLDLNAWKSVKSAACNVEK